MHRYLMVLLFGLTGCATVSAADGHYSVSGITATPNDTIAVSSRARVNETYADAYAEAVREGRAWPSMYGPSGETSFYYGNVAAAPASSAPCANCATMGDLGVVLDRADAAAATAAAAEQKADASLEAHRRLQAALTGSRQKKESSK